MRLKDFFCGLVVCLTFSLVGFAQTSSETEATVQGRVSGNGRGVSGAVVVIWRQPAATPPYQGTVTTKTDREGNFELSISPGNYFIWVYVPGFHVVVKGKPAQKLLPLTLQAGDKADKIDFELKRGGVITGRVTTQDNKPMIDTMVSLSFDPKSDLSKVFPGADTSWTTVRTDDRGIYRFFGIPPGLYQVSAGDSISPLMSSRGGSTFQRVFFPDVIEQEKAKRLRVEDGEEVSGIDIRMRPAEPGFTVSGVIVEASNSKPVSNLTVGVSMYDGEKRIGGRGGMDASNLKGEFSLENIPTGRYTLFVPSTAITNERPTYFGESSRFDVVDQDIKGIVVKVLPTSSVSGWVVLDNPNPNTAVNLQNLRLNVSSMPKSPGRVSFGYQQLGPDGSFTVGGLMPGTLNFNLQSTLLRVVRVERNGSVLPIEVAGAENISDVKVVVTEASGVVRGTIKLSSGSSITMQQGTAGLYSDKGQVAWGQVDARGNFLMENIPAGSYRVIVNVQIPGAHPASTHAEQTVNVKEREVSEVTIWLTPKPTP